MEPYLVLDQYDRVTVGFAFAPMATVNPLIRNEFFYTTEHTIKHHVRL